MTENLKQKIEAMYTAMLDEYPALDIRVSRMNTMLVQNWNEEGLRLRRRVEAQRQQAREPEKKTDGVTWVTYNPGKKIPQQEPEPTPVIFPAKEDTKGHTETKGQNQNSVAEVESLNRDNVNELKSMTNQAIVERFGYANILGFMELNNIQYEPGKSPKQAAAILKKWLENTPD